MMTETEKSKVFEKCPICGGKGRVQEELEIEKEAGRISNNKECFLIALQTVIFDPTKKRMIITPTIQVPTIMSKFDFCSKCGCMFCTSYSREIATLKPQGISQPNIRPKGNGH